MANKEETAITTEVGRYNLLPVLETDDDLLLDRLRVGGVLKVSPDISLAMVRVALAKRANLFGALTRVCQALDRTAILKGEPAPQEFHVVEKMIWDMNNALFYANEEEPRAS